MNPLPIRAIYRHCLPVEAGPLWRDDFEAFLDWRQERLWQEIKRVTGITEAADLEVEVTENA